MNKIRTSLFTGLLAVMMSIFIFPATAFAGGGENIETAPPKAPEKPTITAPLTPEGNLTLVDDIKVEESSDKQFEQKAHHPEDGFGYLQSLINQLF